MHLKECGTNSLCTLVDMSQKIVMFEVGRGTSSNLREGEDLTVGTSTTNVGLSFRHIFKVYCLVCFECIDVHSQKIISHWIVDAVHMPVISRELRNEVKVANLAGEVALEFDTTACIIGL